MNSILEKNFIPSKDSNVCYAIKMAMYSGFLGTMINSATFTFVVHPSVPRIKNFENIGLTMLQELLLGPLLFTALVILLINFLERFRVPRVYTILATSVILSSICSFGYIPRGFIVFPLFVISSVAFIDWNKISFVSAFRNVLLIQIIYSISPFLSLIYFR